MLKFGALGLFKFLYSVEVIVSPARRCRKIELLIVKQLALRSLASLDFCLLSNHNHQRRKHQSTQLRTELLGRTY
jgi:hypothetical protein